MKYYKNKFCKVVYKQTQVGAWHRYMSTNQPKSVHDTDICLQTDPSRCMTQIYVYKQTQVGAWHRYMSTNKPKSVHDTDVSYVPLVSHLMTNLFNLSLRHLLIRLILQSNDCLVIKTITRRSLSHEHDTLTWRRSLSFTWQIKQIHMTSSPIINMTHYHDVVAYH